jgi:hypothetical protein
VAFAGWIDPADQQAVADLVRSTSGERTAVAGASQIHPLFSCVASGVGAG